MTGDNGFHVTRDYMSQHQIICLLLSHNKHPTQRRIQGYTEVTKRNAEYETMAH